MSGVREYSQGKKTKHLKFTVSQIQTRSAYACLERGCFPLGSSHVLRVTFLCAGAWLHQSAVTLVTPMRQLTHQEKSCPGSQLLWFWPQLVLTIALGLWKYQVVAGMYNRAKPLASPSRKEKQRKRSTAQNPIIPSKGISSMILWPPTRLPIPEVQ